MQTSQILAHLRQNAKRPNPAGFAGAHAHVSRRSRRIQKDLRTTTPSKVGNSDHVQAAVSQAGHVRETLMHTRIRDSGSMLGHICSGKYPIVFFFHENFLIICEIVLFERLDDVLMSECMFCCISNDGS